MEKGMETAFLPRKEYTMKRIISVICAFLFTLPAFVGCSRNDSLLDPKNPVTLTMWHVYGEQAASPMDKFVDEFNSTVGKERGIVINDAGKSNASEIGEKLLNARNGVAGAPSMPDLFFCHASNAEELGAETLIDWKELFTQSELDEFSTSFLKDGLVGDRLSVLPVSKSTHLLFLASGVFERFAKKSRVTYDDLKTWDGFLTVAKKYYDLTGKPFCAFDYIIRSTELDAMSRGATDFYSENSWYKNNDVLLSSFTKFANAIAKGHIIVSDKYSNTQVMTGQTVAGISSSAAVLYYNDRITYEDNTSELVKLKAFPVPQSGVGENYATQAGVGLCANKTTAQKAEAALVFAKWFTEAKRNLDFVAQTGYMPVKNGAFDNLESYTFKTEAFKNTYLALKSTKESCVFVSEPSIKGYYNKTYALYNGIRNIQNDLEYKYKQGETEQTITQEIVDLFLSVGN